MEQQESPTLYLNPQDDGLIMRSSGQWVAEKLFYLQRYLYMFVVSMSSKQWRAINYIDLFAGPGKCYVEGINKIHLGSPLLAITAPRPFTNYFFADCDPENIETLKQRCVDSPLSDRIRYYVGDSNIRVIEIVDHIKRTCDYFVQGEWPSLNLAFLDPEGLELHWQTIVALAELRTDLIIHYSQMGVTRAAPVCLEKTGETEIDRFFGSRKWQDTYAASASVAHLEEFYRGRLQELGYKEVLRDDEIWTTPLIRSSQKRAPLYKLLFASKSPLGHKFWQSVTSKDVYGQQRLPLF